MKSLIKFALKILICICLTPFLIVVGVVVGLGLFLYNVIDVVNAGWHDILED